MVSLSLWVSLFIFLVSLSGIPLWYPFPCGYPSLYSFPYGYPFPVGIGNPSQIVLPSLPPSLLIVPCTSLVNLPAIIPTLSLLPRIRFLPLLLGYLPPLSPPYPPSSMHLNCSPLLPFSSSPSPFSSSSYMLFLSYQSSFPFPPSPSSSISICTSDRMVIHIPTALFPSSLLSPLSPFSSFPHWCSFLARPPFPGSLLPPFLPPSMMYAGPGGRNMHGGKAFNHFTRSKGRLSLGRSIILSRSTTTSR